MPLVDTVAVP